MLEQPLDSVYEKLKSLADRDDGPPGVATGIKQAQATLWIAVNDLGIDFE